MNISNVSPFLTEALNMLHPTVPKIQCVFVFLQGFCRWGIYRIKEATT